MNLVNRASAIPLPILIALCLCLSVLNILVLVAAFLLLDLSLFVLLVIALAFSIIVFAAIVGLLWQRPQVKIQAVSDRPVVSRSEERPSPRAVSPGFEKPKPVISHSEERPAPRAVSPSFENPKPIVAAHAEPRATFNRGFDTTKSVSTKCAHGKTREYCAICDPDGYKHHYGDWEKD